jgi:hypothetical protein
MIDDDEVLAVDDRIADTAMGVQVERNAAADAPGAADALVPAVS